jgi:hypothetical protein
MMLTIKNLFLNNKTIKVLSLIIGYSLWSFLGQIYTVSQWVEAPVCFYNIPAHYTLEAKPEKILLFMSGKRADIARYAGATCHIDAAPLREGENSITPAAEHLFLPRSIKLLYCKPHALTITMKKD